jgi:hypothetical protein
MTIAPNWKGNCRVCILVFYWCSINFPRWTNKTLPVFFQKRDPINAIMGNALFEEVLHGCIATCLSNLK